MFKKIPTQKSVVEFIVEQIEQAIIGQGLKPGDKLPTSRELQKMLGTSQGTLREALRILEQKGLVEARPGRSGGLYVRAVTSDQVSESLALLIRQEQISLEHLTEFRCTLEVSAASLAAIMATPEDIGRLKGLYAEAEQQLEGGNDKWEAFYRVEDRMHRTLAGMTKNPLFESVLVTVYTNCPGYNILLLIPANTENMRDTLADWEQMIKTFEARRPDLAGWIMTRHLQRFLPTEMASPATGRERPASG